MTQPGRQVVVHVFNALRPSGGEGTVLQAANAWSASGYEIEVVAKAEAEGPLAQEFRRAGIPVIHLGVSPRVSLLLRAYRLFRHRRADVVHVHAEDHNFEICVAATLARARPVVRTVHAPFTCSPAGRLKRTVQRYVLRQLGVVMIGVGQSVAENEMRLFSNPCSVIPNGAELAAFAPVTAAKKASLRHALGLPKDQGRILISVGNCAPVKNHDAILNALRRLPGWLYVHVGEEDDQQAERRLARTLGVSDQTLFVGPQRNVADWLAASDAFVMPSRYEGMPLAALEALSSGLPCVLAPRGGLLELDVPGSGIMWAGNSAQIVNCLNRLPIAGPTTDGIASIRRRFTIDAMAARYADIYS